MRYATSFIVIGYSNSLVYVWVAQSITITQGSDQLRIFEVTQTASGFPMLKSFCSKCGSNIFMQPGDKVSKEMGLKIISYGCMDCEEGDGRWGELDSIQIDNDTESRSGFSGEERGFPRPTSSFRSNREGKEKST
jgi:hypothetical protein